MKKRMLPLLLALALGFSLLSSCTDPNAAVSPAPSDQGSWIGPGPSPTPTPEVSKPVEGPVTLTDQTGREVTVNAPAQRIVSGYYISTSACIALGLGDRMVGIENKMIPIYDLAAPSFRDLPKVGTAKQFDLETCLSLDPDLVILPKKLKDAAETLTEHGVPVLLVNPENREQLVDMLDLIGEAAGVSDRAFALSSYYQSSLDKLDALLEDGVKTPTVYMAGNSSYLTTAPKDMYQADLIRQGGGVNAADALEGDAWTEVSYEQVLAMDPQVILLPSDATYTVDDVLSDPQLDQVSAVKGGHVYAMPNAFEAWDSPVPSCVLGSQWIMAVLHPDLYSIDDLRTDAAAFYSIFYGVKIDTSLITGITTSGNW